MKVSNKNELESLWEEFFNNRNVDWDQMETRVLPQELLKLLNSVEIRGRNNVVDEMISYVKKMKDSIGMEYPKDIIPWMKSYKIESEIYEN